jgi:hypothetical protein
MRSETIRKEKKMRRNNTIIGILLLSLMVFSMFAYYFSSPDGDVNPDLKYNNYTFAVEDVQGGQMISTTVNNQKYFFYTLPSEAKRTVENLTGVSIMRSSPKIIFVNEPLGLNNQVSSDQLYFDVMATDVMSFSGKQIVLGLSAQDDFSDKTVYACENSSSNSPVVRLKKGIYQQINITEVSDNCFEITSDTMNLLILRDYLIYTSLNIIV